LMPGPGTGPRHGGLGTLLYVTVRMYLKWGQIPLLSISFVWQKVIHHNRLPDRD